MSNFNEAAYGNVADSYAQKYGIPTDVFRDVIRQSSGFDPMAPGGIANIDPGKTDVNVMDIGTGLDIAGQFIADAFKQTKDWTKAGNIYLGEDTIAEEPAPVSEEQKAINDKKFWQYSFDDIKAIVTNSAWGLLFALVGVLIIVATVYTLIAKGSDKGK